MEQEEKKSLATFLSDDEVKIVWREDSNLDKPPKVGRGKIMNDDDNFVYLSGEKGTVIVNKKDIIAVKFATEQWLDLHQVPYHRLLFDKPDNAIFVNETPSNAKYYAYDDDVKVVAELFEEWKQEWSKNGEERRSKTSR